MPIVTSNVRAASNVSRRNRDRDRDVGKEERKEVWIVVSCRARSGESSDQTYFFDHEERRTRKNLEMK